MRYRFYMMIFLCVYCAPSKTMNEAKPPLYRLADILNEALMQAEVKYQAVGAESQNADTLKILINDALSETIQEMNVPSGVLPVLHALMIEEFRSAHLLFDMANLHTCDDSITAVDIASDGTRILAGAGNIAYFFVKKKEWSAGRIEHDSPITAVCLAENDRLVTTDKGGHVFVWNCQDDNLQSEVSFKLPEQYASMIALNKTGDKVACGFPDKQAPVAVYNRMLERWNEEATIPIFKLMKQKSLEWTAENRLLAYGTPVRVRSSDDRMLTEWVKVSNAWYCTADIYFSLIEENDVLAKRNYTLTRRGSDQALSAYARYKVIGEGNSLQAGPAASATFDAIVKYLAKKWK